MLRLLCLCCALLLMTISWTACAKSGTTREEKAAAQAVAEEVARTFPGVGDQIIDLTVSHGKMEIIIKEGVHPAKQAEFLQKIAMDWYAAYPEGKKPTVNDMVQVWLYVNDKNLDEVGFMKCYADQYGNLKPDFHHYKTQQAM